MYTIHTYIDYTQKLTNPSFLQINLWITDLGMLTDYQQ